MFLRNAELKGGMSFFLTFNCNCMGIDNFVRPYESILSAYCYPASRFFSDQLYSSTQKINVALGYFSAHTG